MVFKEQDSLRRRPARTPVSTRAGAMTGNDERDHAFQCAICFARYDASPGGDYYPMQLTCGHMMCRSCVDHIAARSNMATVAYDGAVATHGIDRVKRLFACPFCRKPVCVGAAPCYQYLDALAGATKAPAPAAAPDAHAHTGEPRICDECFVRVLDRAGGEIGIAQLCKYEDVLCDACKNELHVATGFVPVFVANADDDDDEVVRPPPWADCYDGGDDNNVIDLCARDEPVEPQPREGTNDDDEQQHQEGNAGAEAEEEQEVEDDDDEEESQHSTGGDGDDDEDWMPNGPPLDIHLRVRVSASKKSSKKRCVRARSLAPSVVVVIVRARRPREGAAPSQPWAIEPYGRRQSWCPMDNLCVCCQRHEAYVLGRGKNPRKKCAFTPRVRKRARSRVA